MQTPYELDLGVADSDATPEGVERLTEALHALWSEMAVLDSVKGERRDTARIVELNTQAAALSARLERAKRGLALRRLSAYAARPPALDRARHLEVICGDVTRLLVEAQVLAEDGRWEDAEALVKAAKARCGDAGNLVKLAKEGALDDARAGQLALGLE